MRRKDSQQALIIGMTLAEVFLLTMLVGWLGTRNEITVIAVGKKELATENRALVDRLNESDMKRVEAEKKYQELLATAGRRDPRTGAEVPIGEKPKCDPADNVLIAATQDGNQSLATLLRAFDDHGTAYSKGQVLRGTALEQFLKSVLKWSDAQQILRGQPGCRWQYQLTWTSDTDYRLGRQLFEGVFYVALLRQGAK